MRGGVDGSSSCCHNTRRPSTCRRHLKVPLFLYCRNQCEEEANLRALFMSLEKRVQRVRVRQKHVPSAFENKFVWLSWSGRDQLQINRAYCSSVGRSNLTSKAKFMFLTTSSCSNCCSGQFEIGASQMAVNATHVLFPLVFARSDRWVSFDTHFDSFCVIMSSLTFVHSFKFDWPSSFLP